MVGPERWDTPYTYESLFDKPRSHHNMSHNQAKCINDLLKVDHFHMEQFAYLVEKMDSMEEANGTSLLDNTIFTYGSVPSVQVPDDIIEFLPTCILPFILTLSSIMP